LSDDGLIGTTFIVDVPLYKVFLSETVRWRWT
jgi:hypothetical protein